MPTEVPDFLPRRRNAMHELDEDLDSGQLSADRRSAVPAQIPDCKKRNGCRENVGPVNQIDVRAGRGDPSHATNLRSTNGDVITGAESYIVAGLETVK